MDVRIYGVPGSMDQPYMGGMHVTESSKECAALDYYLSGSVGPCKWCCGDNEQKWKRFWPKFPVSQMQSCWTYSGTLIGQSRFHCTIWTELVLACICDHGMRLHGVAYHGRRCILELVQFRSEEKHPKYCVNSKFSKSTSVDSVLYGSRCCSMPLTSILFHNLNMLDLYGLFSVRLHKFT